MPTPLRSAITLHPIVFELKPKIRLNGGAAFRNTFIEDAQGNPQSQIYWDEAQWQWDVRFIGDAATMDYVIGFFLARRGGGNAWLLRDVMDHTASAANQTGIVKTAPDGKRYLFKRYPDNFSPYLRRIFWTEGAVTFSGVSGNPVVNPQTGEVTGATSDGYADFNFLCPCLFTSDRQMLSRAPGDAGSEWQITVREISKFIVVEGILVPHHTANTSPTREIAAQSYLLGTTRLSCALRIVRSDGQVFAFTDAEHDTLLPSATWGNITIPETLYLAGEANFPKNLSQSRDIRKVDNFEFTCFVNGKDPTAGYVTAADVSKGLFHAARFSFIIFARDRIAQKYQWLRMRGRVGEKTLDKGSVAWKMNGLSRALQSEVLDVTSPTSRAVWGDPELSHFNLNGNTQDGHPARVTGTVTNVNNATPRRVFNFAGVAGHPSGRFSDGTVTWLSGPNAGQISSVLDCSGTTFTLDDNTRFPISVGDQLRAQIAPPRTLAEHILITGDGKYFAGEPEIPSNETSNIVTRA